MSADGRAAVPARPAPSLPRRPVRPAGARRAAETATRSPGLVPTGPATCTAHIHWAASARLSEARGTDEFVVREFFAEQAPRVALVADRRPAMAIHPSPHALARQAACSRSRRAADRRKRDRGARRARSQRRGRPAAPTWLRGRRPVARARSTGARRGAYDGDAGSLRAALDAARARCDGAAVRKLRVRRLGLPRTRCRHGCGLACAALRWDVTPVVVQDPVWESSFPAVGGAAVPLADPATGRVEDVWFSRRGARERAAANEARLARLLALFRRLGFDPVLVDTADAADDRRAVSPLGRARRRSWRAHS